MSRTQDTKTLQKILLDIGGKETIIYKDEPDFYNLFTRGVLIDRPSDKIIAGEMCQCHKNSAFLWEKNKKKYKLMTGYALSSTGIWHQHSWILENDKIIETTIKREKYFGYILDTFESEVFLYQYKEKERV